MLFVSAGDAIMYTTALLSLTQMIMFLFLVLSAFLPPVYMIICDPWFLKLPAKTICVISPDGFSIYNC
jgi:hypothetical protein